MGKKIMKLPSLFKSSKEPAPKKQHSCQFLPTCGHEKTLSFKARDDIFKTVKSVLLTQLRAPFKPESWFTSSFESARFSAESEDYSFYEGQTMEVLVRAVRSERLFFEPGNTSSILDKAKASGFPFKESVELAMESEDPYGDFRRFNGGDGEVSCGERLGGFGEVVELLFESKWQKQSWVYIGCFC